MDGVQRCGNDFDADVPQLPNERACRGEYDDGCIRFPIQVFKQEEKADFRPANFSRLIKVENVLSAQFDHYTELAFVK